MTDHAEADDRLKDVLDLAAEGFEPAPDLRSRVDRRAGRQRRTAQLGLATGLVVLVVLAASITAVARRSADGLDVGSNGSIGSVTSNPAGEVAAAPSDWSTQQVTFRAGGVLIDVGGMRFTGSGEGVELHSDPGIPDQYQTLERIWQENGVEMRVNIYFKSDGVDWWSDEIRTYNGAVRPAATWVTYTGEFFRRPLGQAFTGDLVLPDQSVAHDGDGRFLIRELELLPFLPPTGCSSSAGSFTLEVLDPDITIKATAYGVNSNLYDGDCEQVTDLGAYRFVYSASTDGIVSVMPSCSPAALPTPNCESRADLLPVANGSTVLRVDVLGPGDELVATGSMAVTVARSDLPTAVSTTAPG